jgi:hypothetical protein
MDFPKFQINQKVAHVTKSLLDEVDHSYIILKRITEETDRNTSVFYRVRELIDGKPTSNVLRFDECELKAVV